MKKTLHALCAFMLFALLFPFSPAASATSDAVWSSRMPLPTESEIDVHASTQRSPYIVWRPVFSNCSKFGEYSVDFRVDHLPNGTYLAVCCWDMDLSRLKKTWPSASRAYGGVAAYAGFQVLSNGKHVAIMSVWDTYCKDKKGNTKTIRARITWPGPESAASFSGEGEGVKCIVPCDWKEGRSYRALIQEGRTSSGDTTLEFWLYDLLSGTWTKLVEYDTGIPDAYMCKACAFLENFDEDYARDVRSAELWNFRARSVKTGKWVGAKTATMEQCYDYPGSYNYGSTGNVFWAVTTGVPGKCKKPPQSKKYKVTACETGSPY